MQQPLHATTAAKRNNNNTNNWHNKQATNTHTHTQTCMHKHIHNIHILLSESERRILLWNNPQRQICAIFTTGSARPLTLPHVRPSVLPLRHLSLSRCVHVYLCGLASWLAKPQAHTHTHTYMWVFWWSQLPDASQQQQWKQQQQQQQQQWQQQLQTTYINRFNEIPVKPNSQQPGQVRAVSLSKIWLEAAAAASDRAPAAASAAATAARSKCQASERFLSEGVADGGTGSCELERAMEQPDRTLQKVKKSLRA